MQVRTSCEQKHAGENQWRNAQRMISYGNETLLMRKGTACEQKRAGTISDGNKCELKRAEDDQRRE